MYVHICMHVHIKSGEQIFYIDCSSETKKKETWTFSDKKCKNIENYVYRFFHVCSHNCYTYIYLQNICPLKAHKIVEQKGIDFSFTVGAVT